MFMDKWPELKVKYSFFNISIKILLTRLVVLKLTYVLRAKNLVKKLKAQLLMQNELLLQNC